MKKLRKFLPNIIPIIIFLCIFSNIGNIRSYEDTFSRLRTADYKGISIGFKWTVRIDSKDYYSFNVTSISTTEVRADNYVNGAFNSNQIISNDFIHDDTWTATMSSIYGTYNHTYALRLITVCKTFMINPEEYEIIDIATGIIVEADHPQRTLILTSWDLYQPNDIPGYSHIIIFLSIIGISAYMTRKRITKIFKKPF
ncbi:MAG: hypothetical protein ACFE88_06565 [Candidatus Hermodarchaeota archaeon]